MLHNEPQSECPSCKRIDRAWLALAVILCVMLMIAMAVVLP